MTEHRSVARAEPEGRTHASLRKRVDLLNDAKA
jgi:hypothetical protein